MSEMPQMLASQYMSTTAIPGQFGITTTGTLQDDDGEFAQADISAGDLRAWMLDRKENIEIEDDEMTDTPQRRLVKVFMADPDTNIPLEDCLLYSGEEQLTDLTDEELFFEIPVKQLLDAHNEKRVKIEKETSTKEKAEYLKKARIRDLRMTVVTIAQF